jgi:EAL domain-containing protein (putative c-di-GMP-specific phosphodiesterase class I)
MLKEFRNLMQMLDTFEGPAPIAVAPAAEPAAVDIPQSVEQARPAVAPSTFVFDTDEAHGAGLAKILGKSGVAAEVFTSTPPFVRGLLSRKPSMIFLEVAGQGEEAIDALFAMGERNYGGGVQLMGAESCPVLDVVRRMGQRHSLQMLPSVRKPIDTQVARAVLESQNFKLIPAPTPSLAEALAHNWIEFWYQPKIDLTKRQIAGVETFARIRHPELGTIQPGVFMKGATEADLLRLAQHGLVAALKAAARFSDVGINLRVAVNVPVRALFDLPIRSMVAEHGPRNSRWPGLLLDVTAPQLLEHYAKVEALGLELVACNVRLAIDDFGKANLSMSSLKQLPLAELKLDRGFVQGCADDPGRAGVCRTVIDLAHHIGAIAVAVGIEQATDMKMLASIGCNVGQGFLFGQPMPEENLVAILLKRAVPPSADKAQAQAPGSAPVAAPLAPRRPASPMPAEQSLGAAPKLKRAVWS